MSKKENFITVSNLNEKIKGLILKEFDGQIKVKGEISNVKISNGNTFLTLKDEESSINVVSWRNEIKNIKNGDDVIVTGTITCYPKQGSYQITTYKIDRIGIGNLHEKIEKNKKTFDEKGYFSKSKEKIGLPTKINRIGILTAKEGAAIQDVLYQLKANSFTGEVYIKNCNVQGQMCPQSICDGIEYFNKLDKTKPIDILLVTRGGGSFEDLIGYSSKEVVKAIHQTSIYTISAVGHEIDTMLSDYSANYRAPTPSIAGEVISLSQKKKKDILDKQIEKLENIKYHMMNRISSLCTKMDNNYNLLKAVNPIHFIELELTHFQNIKKIVDSKIKKNVDDKIENIQKLKNKNETYNPAQIFKSGYVAIIDDENNLVSNIAQFKEMVKNKKKLKLVFSDGEIDIPISYKKS